MLTLEEIGRRAAALARLANRERHRGQLDRIRGEAVALLLTIREEQYRQDAMVTLDSLDAAEVVGG